jgi:hypothetical protein
MTHTITTTELIQGLKWTYRIMIGSTKDTLKKVEPGSGVKVLSFLKTIIKVININPAGQF